MRISVASLVVLLVVSGLLGASTSTVTFLQEGNTTKQSEPTDPSSLVGGIVGGASQRTGTGVGQPGAPGSRAVPGRQPVPGEAVQPGQGPASVVTGAAGPTAPRSNGLTGVSGQGMKFNFQDADIDRVIASIMTELGYSYVIDPAVDGTVNIMTMRPIPRDKLFGVLEQLLKMNGQAIIKQDNDMYVIVPINQSPTIPHAILMAQSQATSGSREESSQQEENPEQEEAEEPTEAQEAPESEDPESVEEGETGPEIIRVTKSEGSFKLDEEGVVTYIIPLHYFPSDQMIQMAQAFLSPGSTVVDFQPANMLILTDYPRNVEQVVNLVDVLDTRYFSINSVDLVPVRYNQAVDVAEDLGKIFAPGDTATGVRLVAIERLNSILVVTRASAVFEEVMKWMKKLDTPSSSSNMRTFVYQVENSTAVQIAQILAELYQDGLGLPSSQTSDIEQRTGTLQGNLPRDQGGLMQQQQAFREPGFTRSGSSGGFGGTGGYDPRGFGTGNLGMRELGPQLSRSAYSQISAIYAGNVKIVVNEFNNSLIVQGSESDIQFILDTVKQLDTLPRQVLIEARIYAVELRDDLSFGVSAFLQERGTAEGPATTGSISAPGESGSGGAFTLSTRAVIGDSRELLAVVNALRTKTDVQVVDAPRVLALDGTPASINVGAEVPVTSASFGNPLQSGTTNFVNSIQFRPTGTTLLIVPRVSASGVISMDVVLEISSAEGPALTPTINRNYVQSSFIVRDGQTVGIAGLISEGSSLSKSRVPLLGDIPILGALFGTTERNNRRREMVIFITPSVIRSLPTAAELTLDFKRALKNSYGFINQFEGDRESLIEQRRNEEMSEQAPD